MPLHRNSGSWGRILLGLTLKQQLSTRLALMICLRRKLTVGKKSRVTGGGEIAMSRRFSTSTLLTRPKPFPSEARPFARAAASLAAGVSLAASLNRIEHQPSTLSGAGSSTAAVARCRDCALHAREAASFL
jgi:hypothetical protein